MNSPEFCEVAARSGLDFVIVDMEHGSFGIEAAVNMIRAVEAGGAAAVVRVPDATRTNILKVLDAGAAVVLVFRTSRPKKWRNRSSIRPVRPDGTAGRMSLRARHRARHRTVGGLSSTWAEKNVLVGITGGDARGHS